MYGIWANEILISISAFQLDDNVKSIFINIDLYVMYLKLVE